MRVETIGAARLILYYCRDVAADALWRGCGGD